MRPRPFLFCEGVVPMIEILWHGRGGQGAFTAARLLGAAGSLANGRYALAFPSFGPERRGAPMRAFTKVSDAPIGDRSAIHTADYVVYLDDTLFDDGWDAQLKPGGYALVNSTHGVGELQGMHPAAEGSTAHLMAIDANGISQEILGRPIPNTVFLGAIAALSDALTIEDVEEAIRQYMAPKLHEKNERIVRAAAQQVAKLRAAEVDAERGEGAGCAGTASGASGREAGSTGVAEAAGVAEVASDAAADAGATSADASSDASAAESVSKATDALVLAALAQPPRPACAIPTLRDGQPLPPERYARTTCYEAGYLVARNAGWRNLRPVIDQGHCAACRQCYMVCPDGAIYCAATLPDDAAANTASSDGRRAGKPLVCIDYDFCKGCGVCARACRFGAVLMVPEARALAVEEQARAQAQEGAQEQAGAQAHPSTVGASAQRTQEEGEVTAQ